MHRNAFTNKTEGHHFRNVFAAIGALALLFLGQTAALLANPTGGAVVAGGATIGAAGPTLWINQSTRNAIINWQQFSVGNGETTKFFVPSNGATLNRVTGGNLSAIYGNLQSNGALYLVNPNGIVVGPTGRINTASFSASTLDVSNQQFMAGGDLEFAGSSSASVENDGVIHATTGDVYLIGNQVANKGTLGAPQGTVGLAAGSDVLFQQAGNQHLFVQATPAGTKRALGVTNAGTIRAAAAELKAAGGNAYALAINNSGVIAATGFKKVNGQVYLTSDGGSISNSGKISAKQANGNGGKIALTGTSTTSAKTANTVTNSGTLDASATVAGGTGGSVSIKNMSGKTVFSGTILAKGGQGGQGGTAEVSGATVGFTGKVDLTAPGGTTGNLLLDPATLDVITNGSGTVVGGENDSTSTTISPNTVEAALASANLILNADESLTITNGITWTSANTLTLSTNDTEAGGMDINAPITGVNGSLIISASSNTTIIGTGANGSINVGSFTLQQGEWEQINTTLPAFTAHTNFVIQGGTFIRALSGDGNQSPYQITDVYGLQGIGSPTGTLESATVDLANSIDASGTAGWNSGTGFKPIGSFFGTFDGQGFAINGLSILSGASDIGLFGSNGGTIMNVAVTNIQFQGSSEVGGLVGANTGTITNASTSGTISAESEVGGLVGTNSGTISGSSSSAAVTVLGGGDDVGGFAGFNTGTITNSSASGAVNQSGAADGLGGFIGFTNGGSVSGSFSTGAVSSGDDSEFAGGFEGDSIGSLSDSYNTGSVTVGNGSSYIGGLEGGNGDVFYTEGGSINNSYNTGSVTTGTGSFYVGGVAGYNNTATIDGTQNSGTISAPGSTSVGALVGYNTGDSTVTNSSFSDVADGLPAIGTNFSTGVTTGITMMGTPPSTTTTQPVDTTTTTTPVTSLSTAPQEVQNAVTATVPQTSAVVVPTTVVAESAGTQPFNYVGTGIASGYGLFGSGLADASSNSAQVGSGDAAQLNGGQLNSVADPQAADSLNQALGPIVYQNLADALKAIGNWADVPDAGDNTASGGGSETILTGGDVAEVTATKVKNIPLSEAPAELQKAMKVDVLGGAGH